MFLKNEEEGLFVFWSLDPPHSSLRKEEEERLALLDVYTALDVDGDSRLTAKEIEKAMIYSLDGLMTKVVDDVFQHQLPRIKLHCIG